MAEQPDLVAVHSRALELVDAYSEAFDRLGGGFRLREVPKTLRFTRSASTRSSLADWPAGYRTHVQERIAQVGDGGVGFDIVGSPNPARRMAELLDDETPLTLAHVDSLDRIHADFATKTTSLALTNMWAPSLAAIALAARLVPKEAFDQLDLPGYGWYQVAVSAVLVLFLATVGTLWWLAFGSTSSAADRARTLGRVLLALRLRIENRL
jgi:hypothetical protein